jgi:peptide chain release factor 1
MQRRRIISNHNKAIVEIRSAEGGDHSKLLVKDFFDLYLKWCKIKGFKAEITYISHSQIGWSKVEFTVSGNNVYNIFLFEAGGHRVQRVSQTEKRGRVHTSTITVAVLPIIENNIQILEKDLEWSTFRSSGPGGQNVNKEIGRASCRERV